MAVKWIAKINPKHILEKIDKSKSINSEGKISFEGFSLEDNKAALNHMLDFNSDVPDYERKRIIWQGLVNTGEKTTIDQVSFLKEVTKLQGNYLRRKEKTYVLSSSLSFAYKISINKKVFQKSTFTFTRYLPKKYQEEKEKIYKYAKYSIIGEIPNNYLNVRVSIQGRSEYDAIDKSLFKLDLIRGIWNLFFNRAQGIRHSTGMKKPVNYILLGPIQTLHYPDGKAATRTFWYETSYLGPVKLFDCKNKLENMLKFEVNVRNLLKSHKYHDSITSLLVRYCRALDEANLSACFLGLWGTLEGLTASGNDSYNVTIRRAAFMCIEPEYHSQVLQNLRLYRNKNVHRGSVSDDIETYVYQLKRYVERLLEFHIANTFKFESVVEAAAFMDHPTSLSELRKRRRMINSAIKYRNS
ncbi:MAG: hypothetical protein JAY72_21200 [Candidatus Thiodiazotropha endolucinida]|nr:hypothetical protein [Candidatus Thiodiazotropha taylori]MCW4324201.1 hypothetical protein [Candidatus Thiodiazotropha taylori]